jgi:hypothetical protein
MSYIQTNQDILDFINANFTYNYPTFQDEIDILFNNLISQKCSFAYVKSNYYTVIGLPNKIDDITSFSYLIPNLFRKCFINKSVSVPSICPSFIYISSITFYYPYLIDTKLMKSFLYFAFTTDILKYNPENIQTYIEIGIKYRLNYINNIKRNTNYGSYTSANIIFNEIYPQESLIQQLCKLSSNIAAAEYATSNSQQFCPYEVPWNYTVECVCASGIVSSTDIFGNELKLLTKLTLRNMFILLYTNYFKSPTLLQNTGLKNVRLLNNSIFFILHVSNQVIEDILIKIDFYITNKYYCDKDYMSVSNLPLLYELYTNYYNNQIYVNSQTNNSPL